MSNDSMGNLEKLGILVIVILVVVVGVVAITPEETLFPEPSEPGVADLDDDANGRDADREEWLPSDRETELERRLAAARRERLRAEELRAEELRAEELRAERLRAERLRAEEEARRRADEREIWPTPPDPVVDDSDDSADRGHTARNDADDTARDDPGPIRRNGDPEPAPSPAFRDYVVQGGDSFYRIAERELGDVRRAKDIQAANPSVDPRALQPGQTLRLPLTSGSGSARRGDSAVPGRDSAATGRTYTVRPGDTAMGISSTLYGTVRHWKRLLEHNGISAPNALRADTVLDVPEIPADRSRETRSLDPPSSSEPVAVGGADRTYDVQRGETLMGIAAAELGDGGRWREILDLNGMSSANELRAGATIRLPPR